jgi:hypothetical protein
MSKKSMNVQNEKESLKSAKKRKEAEGESLTQESKLKTKSKEYSSKDLVVDAENVPNSKYEVSDSEKEEEILENLDVDPDNEVDPEDILEVSKEILDSSDYSFEELRHLKDIVSADTYYKIIDSMMTAFQASNDLIAEQTGALALKKELDASNEHFEDLIRKKERKRDGC